MLISGLRAHMDPNFTDCEGVMKMILQRRIIAHLNILCRIQAGGGSCWVSVHWFDAKNVDWINVT